jgi:hypothetical protein
MTAVDTSREAVERLAEIWDRSSWAGGGFTHTRAAATIRTLLDERNTAQAECLEQARLNGMGAERELALMAERDRLRDALRPFAEAADDLDEDHIDKWEIWESPAAMSLTAGDLRKARAALGERDQDNV